MIHSENKLSRRIDCNFTSYYYTPKIFSPGKIARKIKLSCRRDNGMHACSKYVSVHRILKF